jgi:hypothetical protein
MVPARWRAEGDYVARSRRDWIAGLAILAVACSSADAQQAANDAPVPGALRARSVGGTDLGLAYGIEPAWPFSVPGGFGTATLVMVLLKEQPAGAVSPVLVYRSAVSGSPLPCARFYQTADCTGTATVSPTQAGTACVIGGRMYRPDFTGTPGVVTYASTQAPRWDPVALALVTECVAGPGTSPPWLLPAIDVGPVPASPGRIFVVPAD